jgi:hypothetical protein
VERVWVVSQGPPGFGQVWLGWGGVRGPFGQALKGPTGMVRALGPFGF